MYKNADDFFYDGQYLSDYGFMICEIDSNGDLENVNPGSDVHINTISRHSGKSNLTTSSGYDEMLTCQFRICHNPSSNFIDDIYITNDEYREMIRWLNRREFKEFYFVQNDEGDTCYYHATFNLEKVYLGHKLLALDLTMITNKPFGYGDINKVKWTIADLKKEYLLADTSDEIGLCYPKIEIEINKNGNFTMKNAMTDCTMVINNCIVGEKITIDSENKIIISNSNKHMETLPQDFNYQFFTIGNTINERNNKISFTLPCKVQIEYRPIIK